MYYISRMTYLLIMETKNDQTVDEWVKTNSSVATVAAELNLSRPTVYKYIRMFDSGEKDKLPDDVVSYFEQKMMAEDDPRFLQKKRTLEESSVLLRKRLEDEKRRMSEIFEKRAILDDEISTLELSPKDETALKRMNDLKQEYASLSKESLRCSRLVNDLEFQLQSVESELCEMEHTEYVPDTTKQVFNIKSSCYIEDGKCMVVHTGDDTGYINVDNRDEEQKLYYRLHLYAKVGNEYAHLGDYMPVPNRNFFIIDDVFLSAPLYYNIVACIEDQCFRDDGEFKRPDGEPNLIELSGSQCTGMCELKQKK